MLFTTSDGATISFDINAVCCIVQLPIDFSSPEEIIFLGTGFYFCSDRIVVTAKHIFTDCDSERGPLFVFNLAKHSMPGLAGHLAIIESTNASRNTDLAVLVIAENQSPHMSPFLPGPIRIADGESVFAIGYSPSQTEKNNKTATIRISANHYGRVKIEERERANTKTEFCIYFDAPFSEHGNSGGPVLNASGRVIGVFSQLFSSASSTNSVVPLCHGRASSLLPLIDLMKDVMKVNTFPVDAVRWILGEDLDHNGTT